MINGVAVRIKATGDVLTELRPKRHGDILNRMSRLGLPTDGASVECGFTVEGAAHQFYTREEAWRVAKEYDQILPGNRGGIPGKLFSEDVW